VREARTLEKFDRIFLPAATLPNDPVFTFRSARYGALTHAAPEA
jgi:hypothetical protein